MSAVKDIRMIPTPGSSNISAIGYDNATRTLRVQFKTGTYEYDEVPAEVWEEFRSAESVGSFFHHRVKGQYPTRKVA